MLARTADANRRRQEQARFTAGRKAERFYAEKLRGVARHIASIIRAFPIGDPAAADAISAAMQRYSEMLDPWAKVTAWRMLEDVSRRDRFAWAGLSEEMGRALLREINEAPTGHAMQILMARQVHLIKSLPIEAAKRVHNLTFQGLVDGTRARETAREILRTSDVTVARANLIARTETARASSTLTQARAGFIGATSYIWRTSRDGSVRESHRKMEGKTVLWASAPVLDGMVGHAGEFPNCRCYPEVIIPNSPL